MTRSAQLDPGRGSGLLVAAVVDAVAVAVAVAVATQRAARRRRQWAGLNQPVGGRVLGPVRGPVRHQLGLARSLANPQRFAGFIATHQQGAHADRFAAVAQQRKMDSRGQAQANRRVGGEHRS